MWMKSLVGKIWWWQGARRQEVEGSENWGPLEGQGCEESYKMGMVGELNILYTIQFFQGYPGGCWH